MVKDGELTAEEAEVHPHRSIITRTIGVEPDVEVDELYLEARVGDRLLICSDGLTGMLSDAQIELILTQDRNPTTAVQRLIDSANEAGGVDNITALLIDIHEGPPSSHPVTATATRAGIPAPAEAAGQGGATDTGGRGGPAEPTGSAEQEPPLPPPRPLAHAQRAIVWLAITLAILVLAFVGFRVYLDTQWYVGVSDGRVAVFRGIPAEVSGFQLHHVVVETAIAAEDAQALALYRDLDEGITAGDRVEADAIVQQIRDDLAQAGGTAQGPSG